MGSGSVPALRGVVVLLPPASCLLSPVGNIPLRYAIATFGCRVNQADSLQLEMRLRARGGTRALLDEAEELGE